MMEAAAPSEPWEPRRYDVREARDRRDVFYLVRLWHHYFGTEYEGDLLPMPLGDLLGCSFDSETYLESVGVVAEHEDVQIGGALAVLRTREGAVEQMPSAGFDPVALAGDRNCWLEISAVDPAWRGHGIGRRLFEHRLEWAAEQDVDMVFAFGWERRHGRSSRPLFERYGFVPVGEFPDHYAASRDSCPDCGIWPNDDGTCRCSMTFWALDGGDLEEAGQA